MADIKTSVLILGQYPPRRFIEIVKCIEDYGYDAFWYADERFFREVYSGLTLAAVNAKRIQLGTCVTDPYTRHPALSAMAIATLDELSEGRAILGVGAGVSGFEALGVKREKPALAIREMVQLLRGLLSGGEVDYEGQLIRFRGRLDFKPIRANIPVYVASNGEHGLRMAGEIADGVIVNAAVSDRMINWTIEHVTRGMRKASRALSTVDLAARVNLCISADSGAAKDMMRAGIARTLAAQQPDFPLFKAAGLEVSAELSENMKGLGYTHDADRLAPLSAKIPDAYVDALTLAGTANQVAGEITRMVRRGITHLIVYPIPFNATIEQTIRTFAQDVMPRVRQTQA